jgi:hypothetical protein
VAVCAAGWRQMQTALAGRCCCCWPGFRHLALRASASTACLAAPEMDLFRSLLYGVASATPRFAVVILQADARSGAQARAPSAAHNQDSAYQLLRHVSARTCPALSELCPAAPLGLPAAEPASSYNA